MGSTFPRALSPQHYFQLFESNHLGYLLHTTASMKLLAPDQPVLQGGGGGGCHCCCYYYYWALAILAGNRIFLWNFLVLNSGSQSLAT